MGAVGVAPQIVDGALAVVVDEPRSRLAVWKGQSRIELHDLGGRWSEIVVPQPMTVQESWDRADVLSRASVALSEVARPPVSTATTSAPAPETVHVELDDLHGSWLVRAKRWGYALWDGEQSVDVYNADGAHRRAIRVPATDLSSLSHLMLGVLALSRRENEPEGA
ncbi:MAG TPA: hypothetical protein DCQ30_13470 [Acidimicrobiaceae bacterium]|nr:hypothetical protein [Acidimicrobiaceae bacterium]